MPVHEKIRQGGMKEWGVDQQKHRMFSFRGQGNNLESIHKNQMLNRKIKTKKDHPC